MATKLIYEYSGELITELEEAQKVCCLDGKDQNEKVKVTSTLGCGTFLTIYCC